MSIAGVCVDRGRLVAQESSAVRVEGRTSFQPVAGQWFRCRLFLGSATDALDTQGAHFKAVSQPQVMTVKSDLDGTLLDIHGTQHMEINSVQLGRDLWRVMGEPQPLRKKRLIIGWLAQVERVIEPAYDDLLNQNIPAELSP